MTPKIYEVGGSLRDSILGRESSDIDYAVMVKSFGEMKDYLVSRGAEIFQERPQFLAIRAKLPELAVTADFTVARKESFYTDGRHPDSVTPADSIEEDLARRDFTINAMAREVGTTEIIDPFNGKYDIQAQYIRAVGVPTARFNEDKLRAFRAIRFATQLNFHVLFDVSEAIKALDSESFGAVTPERLQVELTKAFEADSVQAMVWLAKYPNLLRVIRDKKVWFKPTLARKK